MSLEAKDDTPPKDQSNITSTARIMWAISRWINTRRAPAQDKDAPQIDHNLQTIPEPTEARLKASMKDHALDIQHMDADAVAEEKQTYLYLAYGSNMCYESFQRMRGCRPISKVNVLVPELRLTFDLAGVPYMEPCFGNTARVVEGEHEARRLRVQGGQEPFTKDRWYKPMPGVVYEVEAEDYVHIIASEGGGTTYQDVLVTCYPLASGTDVVPEHPTSQPFKAHTLVAPSAAEMVGTEINRLVRQHFGYAQPSPRYLGLLRTGVKEHKLPAEYDEYLSSIKPFKVTTRRQKIALNIIMVLFGPWIMMVFALMRRFKDKRGKSPWWLSKLRSSWFSTVWSAHDWVLKPLFGDGERTIEALPDSIETKKQQ